ncbi:hypothetical protein [uncultured Thiodictyon sp.]|uniref:hypothetical protein n=1 Tax=uncultured Thiodictyon sp. TaxID=1846217 RepID=UPI0025FA6EAA|nr:hypothetical protein [uncultured Thiodictyon sp.]
MDRPISGTRRCMSEIARPISGTRRWMSQHGSSYLRQSLPDVRHPSLSVESSIVLSPTSIVVSQTWIVLSPASGIVRPIMDCPISGIHRRISNLDRPISSIHRCMRNMDRPITNIHP